MLKEILQFEWRYHTRQPSFVAASCLFLILGFVLTATGFGPQNVALTSPWLVMETLGFLSLIAVFAVAIFVSNAVIRDSEHRMEEIIFTTPIGRFNYLFGRFGGAFAVAATAMIMAPIGMVIATTMPWQDPARVTSINPLVYLWPFVILIMPTLLLITALLFLLATWTRSALATYTASVFIYFLYMAVAALTGSPLMAASAPGSGGGAMVALLDPFGLSSFFDVTRYWTIAEKNHRFLALGGELLLNRALWTGVAAAIWIVTYRTFAFRLLKKTKEKKVRRDPLPTTATPYVRIEPEIGSLRRELAAFRSAAGLEIRTALRSLPFLLLLALWFGLALTEIRSELFEGEYGSASYPTTALVIATLWKPLRIIGLIIVIYYGAELFWRERRFRMAAILDATPVRGMSIVLAKWIGLVAMMAATILAGIAAGVLVQATSGYSDFQPLLYLSLFYFIGLPLALLAAAAIAIHALSPGKYAGMVLVLLFIIGARNSAMVGLDHPLLNFGSGPGVSYTAMLGFSDTVVPFGRLMLHWSVMATGLLLLAGTAWRRLGDGVAARLRAVVRGAASSRGRTVLTALLLLLASTGGWVYYHTNIRGTYRTAEEIVDWKVAYEKRYRPLAAQPMPRITDVITSVEIFPSERRLHITGDYALLNDTQKPIPTIHVSTRRDASSTLLAIPGARHSRDTRFGMDRFDLVSPLAPGAQTRLHFDVTFDSRRNSDRNDGVAENGSLVMGFITFPDLGYRSTYELNDPRERKKRGLGAMSVPENDDTDSPSPTNTANQRVNFDATVSTSEGQTAIAPGHLEREWTAGGRHYAHYRSDSPILNYFGFTSARYSIAHRQVGDVDLSIAFHPGHEANVEAMLDTAARTLQYCDRQFGEYPHHQLKLVEAPAAPGSGGFGGYALPDMILLSESRAFLVDSRDSQRLDLVTRRVAHEVGHQWWGYILTPADRGGELLLKETLAKYTELMILEQTRGRDQVHQQLEYELDRYLSGRAGEEQRERTLANVGDQPYLYYSKGALILYGIRDLIGETALNGALRDLVAENRGKASATTAAFLAQLRKVSNDSQYALIDEWIQKIVLYDLELQSAKVSPLPGGRFEVTATVTAAKRQASSDGTDREVPLDELIDVALFRTVPGLTPSRDLLESKRVELRSGKNEVKFIVSERPGYVAVDPWILRVDRNRFNNGRRIE